MASAFKKYVLINKIDLDRLKERKIQEYNNETNALVRTEKDIVELLADVSIPNDLKIKSLTPLIQKYEILSPLSNPIKEVVTVLDSNASSTADSSIVSSTLPSTPQRSQAAEPAFQTPVDPKEVKSEPGIFKNAFDIPVQYNKKLTELLTIINRNPNCLQSNSKGELILNGNLIPDSSYIDSFREL